MHFCLSNPDSTEKSKWVFYKGLFKRWQSPAGPCGELSDGRQGSALPGCLQTSHTPSLSHGAPGPFSTLRPGKLGSYVVLWRDFECTCNCFQKANQGHRNHLPIPRRSPFRILARFILPEQSKMPIHRGTEIVGIAWIDRSILFFFFNFHFVSFVHWYRLQSSLSVSFLSFCYCASLCLVLVCSALDSRITVFVILPKHRPWRCSFGLSFADRHFSSTFWGTFMFSSQICTSNFFCQFKRFSC